MAAATRCLFQAICRVSRLDGEDKEYGYIIDYKDLFRSLEQSIEDDTGQAFAGYDDADVKGLLKDRLEQGRERQEEAREAVKALCEGIRGNREAVAETIENNVRRLIIDETAVNSKYYEKMSELLEALIRERKQEANEDPLGLL